ncbi:MAG: hydroxyacylglutathione hydrolase [Polyangiaceae bacterium]
MRVVIIPCLSDNYAYLLIGAGGGCVIVDASEAGPVRDAIRTEGVRPEAIWSTHHHHDHVGGNVELAREFGIDVVGHESDRGRLPGLTRGVSDGDVVRAGGVGARCLHVPGHTLGAVAYFVEDPAAGASPVVFTGDTLFCAGCGRLFEGTAEQMHASLGRLAELPADTRVFCGHEYTEANLRFAAHLEAGNQDIAAAQAKAATSRAHGDPAVGTTMRQELRTNPFLRAGAAALRASLGVSLDASDAASFARARLAKDTYH